MNQPTLLLLFGGGGYEHEVSLRSAAALSTSLRSAAYPHLTVGITREGAWYLYSGDFKSIADGSWEREHEHLTPVLPCPRGLLKTESGEILREIVVFPCLHGTGGEDGRMQGLLELYRIPYVGCNAEVSAICMNKSLTKDLLLSHHIPMVGKVAARISDDAETTRLVNRAETRFLYPMFVKPARCGSSVGASLAKSRAECLRAVSVAAQYDSTVLIERYVKGREIELAVLQSSPEAPPLVSPPCEPIYHAQFYDYKAKYDGKGAQLSIPAKLPKHTADVLVRLAEQIFTILGCRHLARVDFFVGENGEVLFNEINTIPGMTACSIFPAAMREVGEPIEKWLPALADAALKQGA